MPSSQGSVTIRLPPGVVMTKVEWPNHVIEEGTWGSIIKVKQSQGFRRFTVHSQFTSAFSTQHSALPTAPLNFIRGRKKRETVELAAAAAQARVAEGPRAGLGELSPPEGADARPRPAHGLRGSQLPEHRRMLAPRHGDVHDPRRHLHPVVRLLQRDARCAEAARRARTGQGRRARSTPSHSTTSSSPRSIATTLPDFGASHFARTIAETRARIPSCRLEVLIPDFKGDEAALRIVLDARPDVLNHNIETVPRLYRTARPGGRYDARSKLLDRSRDIRAVDPDQVRADGRSRRGMGRSRRDAARPARRRLPHRHHRPVPAPLARQPADGRATTRRTSSPS